MNKSVLTLILFILITVSALDALESGPEPVTVLFTSDTEGKVRPYG
ncbi:MAG: hypothetical protein R6U43_05385 [Candidatus Krumholzibacteriales bacterium]